MIFVISSSGVMGRQMKIRSYRRSSMCSLDSPAILPPSSSLTLRARGGAPFLNSVPGKSPALHLFGRGRNALVEAIHGLGDSLGKNQFDRFAGLRHHLRSDFQFGLAHGVKHISRAVGDRLGRLNSQANPGKFIRAERADYLVHAATPTFPSAPAH